MYLFDTYWMEFDMLRQEAEARRLMGSGLPDEFAPALRMRNAALPKNGRTLVAASIRNTLAFPEVSAQMRRLSCPRGYASRRDVLVAADMDAVSEEEDFEAWVAYRKAKRARKDGEGGGEYGKQ